MKKLLCLLLTALMISSVIVPFSALADEPEVVYNCSFDADDEGYSLFGNAKVVYDNQRKGNALTLDGSKGTYAELPQGLFDGRDKMTITMDVKSEMESGNFFTFTYGQDSTNYSFFRMRGCEALFSTTTHSYVNDNPSSALCVRTGCWVNVAIVIDDYCYTVYTNGVKAFDFKPNGNKTGILTSDLGSDLITYLGRSFYDGDLYFKGSFGNFKVYDGAMTADQVLDAVNDTVPLITSMIVGTVVEGESYGTDHHTASNTIVDTNTNTITPYVRKTADIKSIPVRINTPSSECEILIDGKPFVNNAKYNLSTDKKISVTFRGRTVEYLLKTPKIANNAVLEGQYADPDIDYFNGKYWMYPTTDGYWWWRGSLIHAFSSEDLVNWKDEGVVLDVNNKSTLKKNDKGVQIGISPWSADCAWAPTVEAKNGKYYLYYCGELAEGYRDKYCKTDRLMAIGVAVADNPAGPFVPCKEPVCYDALYRSKINDYTGEQIDPSIFTDDDGTSYILTGGSCVASIAKLNKNMTSVDPSSICKIEGMEDFLESVYLIKRNGIYHFTWSCYGTNGQDYCVKYGIAKSLTPDKEHKVNVETKYMLLDKNSKLGIVCTGHQCTLYQKDLDRCFIAYHRFCTPLEEYTVGYGFHRETCIDEVYFDKNGLMKPLTPTMEGTGKVTVRPCSDLTVSLSTTSYIYDGKAKKPTAVVKDLKGKTVSTSNYTISYSDNVGAGTATATIKFKNAYAGTVKRTFKILPKVVLSQTNFTYDGKAKRPTVSVYDQSGKMSAISYRVTFANGRKNVGKYAVKVTFTGKYSGTSTVYFYIKPKNTSISKLTAGSKKFTVKIKKYTTQTTGYQIQYATNSSFKSAKTVTVSNKTTSKTISKLASKKKYYVRIRTYKTVGSTKYYSAWSKAKTVKTK